MPSENINDKTLNATEVLDRQSDTHGLSKIMHDADDWTDVAHSERKKRDRVLDDGVLLSLLHKSDFEGFKRLFTNVAFLLLTARCLPALLPIHMESSASTALWLWLIKLVLFPLVYLFYGFQIQCFGYAAQHELMHRTAFRTRWINDVLLFLVSIPSFEFGKHEKLMHKQHHTYTNNIFKDPELTSFWSPEELANEDFRKVSSSRWDYFWDFFDFPAVMKSHLLRIVNSARGVPVDYTGTKWSLRSYNYSKESGIMIDLQNTARFQILFYVMILILFGRTVEGRETLMFYWIIPAILGFAPINFVRNAEHSGDCEFSNDMNCLKNTRSTKSNFLVRQLMWNMNFHAEHHLYPMVPFYNLPKLSELLDAHLEHNELKSFRAVNLEYVRSGGWIDQQNSGLDKKRKHV